VVELSVGLAVIGDEVLLGEVRDENISLIASELFNLGTVLKYACVLPDDMDILLENLGQMREKFNWVITTGGIGTTHDDITRQAISRLYEVELVEFPEVLELLTKRVGRPLPERLRGLAVFPKGSHLIENPLTAAPGFSIENMIILPGVPKLVSAMLPFLGSKLRGKNQIHRTEIHTIRYESEIAALLEEAQDRYPVVKIGSYPIMNGNLRRVRLVLRSIDADDLNDARSFLLKRIPE